MSDLSKLNDKLSNYYDNLNDEATMAEVVKLFHTQPMRDIFDSFLKDSEKDNHNQSKEYISVLRSILKLCNSIYNYTGNDTGLSDSEYDELYAYYKNLSGDDSLITESVVGESDVIHHKYKSLRGTLDKIYKLTDEDVVKNKSQKTIDDWIATTEKRYYDKTGKNINLLDYDIIVMPKFDGVSCIFECDKDGNITRALTRGDTSRNEAQDITHIVKDIFKGSLKNQEHPYGVKTEVMMLDDKLKEYNDKYHKDYKNTRSIVSSIINSKEKDERVKYLHIVPLRYSYLIGDEESEQHLAPEVFSYPYLECKLKNLEAIREFSFSHKTVYPGLRCDGSVIQIKDPEIQKVLGRENEKQKCEVAFKFTEEKEYSELLDIEFTSGLFGRMNPVAIFKPVKMKGNMVQRASLGSYARFLDLELAKGDTIKVLYDIIPYVDFDSSDYKCKRSGKKPFTAPRYCPDCGSLLEVSEDGGILRCDNSNCPGRMKGKILNFCQKMNISNISFATVEDFYREGFLRSLKDLYDLKNHVNELIQIPGYSTGKINNILNEIDNHREVSEAVLLGSIGIEGFSVKRFKAVLEYFSMEEIIDTAKEKNYTFFTVVPGIKEKTAVKLVDGLNQNMDLIEYFTHELKIEREANKKVDFNVVFTKVRDKDLEQFIIDNYGEVGDSVTSKTNVVVVPYVGVESSKVSKAKKLNIPIIPITDLKQYITDNFL